MAGIKNNLFKGSTRSTYLHNLGWNDFSSSFTLIMLIFDVPEKTRIVFCPMIQICLKSEKNAKSGFKKIF